MNNERTKIETPVPPTVAITPDTAAGSSRDFVTSGELPNAPPGYVIVDLIGRGGMGVVFRARQVSLNRSVALKTITLGPHSHASAAARFEQEAQTIARLQHPHIVTAYDFGRHEGRLFLAMELVEGQDLESYIRERGRLNEATTWGFVRQAAMGLAQAAEHGIVHRDVKPANMLLVSPPPGFPLPAGLPMLKLTDFGLAFLTDDRRDSRLTLEGTTLGSPHYMAPEQVVGADIDLRTDIYGLGATAYHMLTGEPPFPGSSIGQVLAQKLKGETPPLEQLAADVSPATRTLIARMMHERMEARPTDYSELLRLIDTIGDSEGSEHRAARSAKTSQRYKIGHGPLLWLTAIAVLIGIVTAYSLLVAPRTLEAVDRYVPSGWAAPLFDGTTLRGWLPMDGQWSPARDAEGGRVIRGVGTLARQLPQPDKPQSRPLTAYRVSVGCDLNTAAVAELQFGFGPSTDKPRFVLRLEPTSLRLGAMTSDRGEFREIASTPRQSTPRDSETPHYVELRVERHANVWVAYHDGRPFATAEPFAEGTPQICLVAREGEALFDGPFITELEQP